MKKNAKNTIFFVWALAIAACLLLVFCALIFASCGARDGGVPITTEPPAQSDAPTDDGGSGSGDDVQTTSPDGSEDGDTPTDAPSSSALLGETEDAGQEYIDKLTFLGDSTTYGLKAYEVLSGGMNTTQVWTPKSGTLTLYNYATATIVFPETGEEISIVDAVTRKQPEYLVITLGANGVRIEKPEDIAPAFKAALESKVTTILEFVVDGTQLAPPFRRDAFQMPTRYLDKYAHLDYRRWMQD